MMIYIYYLDDLHVVNGFGFTEYYAFPSALWFPPSLEKAKTGILQETDLRSLSLHGSTIPTDNTMI